MSGRCSDTSGFSFEGNINGNRLIKHNVLEVKHYVPVNLSDKSVDSTSASRRSSSFSHRRKQFRNSPISRKTNDRDSQHRERSRTENSYVSNVRNKNSPSDIHAWEAKRLSMPGSSGLSSVYSNADAWITDSIAEKSATPRKREEKCFSKKSKGPFFGSYQLLGDSLFVRFADQILKSPAAIGVNGKFCNGHCVSGQTISDLIQRIQSDITSSKVIVLIGTNDFLRRSSFDSMVHDMKSLLNIFPYCAEKVVILTLPPIPRLENTEGYWSQWEMYNEWLKTVDNGKSVKVIDVAPLFMTGSRTPDMKAFESHMGYGDKKRVDHIHLNRLGLLRLSRKIEKQLNIY